MLQTQVETAEGEMGKTGVDEDLIALAVRMRDVAYAPYSHYHVGAGIRAASGKIYGGCNVENASYGLCNCAERTAIFSAVAAGERVVREVVVATDDGGSPCGACRQVLAEFAPRDGSPQRIVMVDKSGKVVRETTIRELLPLAFALQAGNDSPRRTPLGDRESAGETKAAESR